jgi:S1-C subfamily serine protease
MKRRRAVVAIWTLAAGAALAGCKHDDVWVERSETPGVNDAPAYPQPSKPKENTKAWTSPGSGAVGTARGEFDEFCGKIAAQPRIGSVGCLPLVMYDSDHDGPWVPELGVNLADDVAECLRDKRFSGAVLDSADMAIRLSQVNLDKVTLSSQEAVAGSGDRLGVDVVVFGTMKKDKDPSKAFLQIIKVDLTAYGFQTGALVARKRIELRSDKSENQKAYTASNLDGRWMPGTEWGVPQGTKSLDEELRIVAGILAKRALQGVNLEDVKGQVYLAPTDTGRFVRSIARLRAAQQAFVAEYEKRAKDAAKGESPLDIELPLTLNGVEFKTLQAAFSYLATLREQLLATETARFSSTMTSILAEAVRPLVQPRVVILDAGFTKGSDVQLLEGELATGGLARSLRAREALKEQNIDFVVAPKIEQVGANFALRAEVYDLRHPNLMASSSMRIDARYSSDLARQLAVDEMKAIDDLPAIEKSSWDRVYNQVASGVVALAEGNGWGSGFVVSSTGHIITNSHVVKALDASKAKVLFANGQQSSYQVLKDDPFQDIAVVKAESIPEGTHVFEFAEPGRAKVGIEVAVLGNPKGTSGWVLTPGSLSSVSERVQTTGARPSFMYTCPTRGGNSGSPVLLQDGKVIAVHSAGTPGDVKNQSGYELVTDSGPVYSELTGFAIGVPGGEGKKMLSDLGVGAR